MSPELGFAAAQVALAAFTPCVTEPMFQTIVKSLDDFACVDEIEPIIISVISQVDHKALDPTDYRTYRTAVLEYQQAKTAYLDCIQAQGGNKTLAFKLFKSWDIRKRKGTLKKTFVEAATTLRRLGLSLSATALANAALNHQVADVHHPGTVDAPRSSVPSSAVGGGSRSRTPVSPASSSAPGSQPKREPPSLADRPLTPTTYPPRPSTSAPPVYTPSPGEANPAPTQEELEYVSSGVVRDFFDRLENTERAMEVLLDAQRQLSQAFSRVMHLAPTPEALRQETVVDAPLVH